MRLQDRNIIVTGAGSGFGAAMARLFAAEGARVLVADLNGAAAASVAAEIGANAVAQTADVADRRDSERMIQGALEAFGDLDTVVNNAGYSHPNMPMLEVSEQDFDRVFAVNVKAIYYSALFAVPHLRARGGGVIANIGSTAGIRPRPGLTWYNGSKAAANLLTRSMALELAPDGPPDPPAAITVTLRTATGVETLEAARCNDHPTRVRADPAAEARLRTALRAG